MSQAGELYLELDVGDLRLGDRLVLEDDLRKPAAEFAVFRANKGCRSQAGGLVERKVLPPMKAKDRRKLIRLVTRMIKAITAASNDTTLIYSGRPTRTALPPFEEGHQRACEPRWSSAWRDPS